MTRYMIADGDGNYIRADKSTNRYAPVVGEAHGTMWESKEKAQNIQRTLNKKLGDYRVVEIKREADLLDRFANEV